MQHAQSTYFTTQVSTASAGELTLLLYNGCLKFLKQSKIHTQNKDIEGKHTAITKAINIIDELQITLKMEYEISQQLFQLYNFIRERLILANMRLDESIIDQCIEFVTELRDTWAEALKLVKK